MLKINLALLLILMIFVKDIAAQDSLYARTIIDTLASPSMLGRGYTFDADKMAANYIANELKSNKISSFNSSYFQFFYLNVNVFPFTVDVKIDGKDFQPGKDFLVGSQSCAIKGKYKINVLDKNIINNPEKFNEFSKQNFSKSFILIDTTDIKNSKFDEKYDKIVYQNSLKAKGIISFEEHLTNENDQKQSNFVHLIFANSSKQQNYKTIKTEIDAKLLENYKTQNVIGYIKGKVDTFIVFTAHYDHLGTLGKNVFFPGANDNAAGVAMVLDLAKTFAKSDSLPHYSIAFMLFSGEELGLLGSQYYTQNPVFPLSKIKFLINLDVIGSGDDGIQIVNSSVFTKEYEQLLKINDSLHLMKKILKRGAAANSDHYFFYKNGVPSFFIYSRGSYLEYHNIYDTRENVPLYAYNNIFKLVYLFALKIQ